MSMLDLILLAFLAGLATRDLWPLWIRRADEPKKLGERKRLVRPRR